MDIPRTSIYNRMEDSMRQQRHSQQQPIVNVCSIPPLSESGTDDRREEYDVCFSSNEKDTLFEGRYGTLSVPHGDQTVTVRSSLLSNEFPKKVIMKRIDERSCSTDKKVMRVRKLMDSMTTVNVDGVAMTEQYRAP